MLNVVLLNLVMLSLLICLASVFSHCYAECNYAGVHVCWMLCFLIVMLNITMLRVTYKTFMQSANMLSVMAPFLKLSPLRIAQIGWWKWLLLSISPIFYDQLFRTKVFHATFMYLQFGFVIFWRKDFGKKAAHKMLVKLTPEAVFLVVCDPSMNELWAT